MDLGLRPLPGPRREDGVPSVPRGLGRAPRRVAALAARRRRGRPLHLHRRDARRQAGRVRAPGQGQRPVQVVLARRTRLAGASTGRIASRSARRGRARRARHLAITLVDKGSVAAQRPVVTAGKGGCARRRPRRRPAGRQARRRRVAGLRRLVEVGAEGRSPPAALRPAARPARDGSQLRAGQAGVPREERDDAARADRERPRRVAAALERRRHLGPLARDARRAGRLGLQGERSRSTSSSSAASRGRSSPSRASATSARCPAGTARATRRRRAR